MTYSKSSQFDPQQQELARWAKVLAHPARIAILQHLAKTKACISGDIAQELPLSRTTVSQHLQELKSAGLIKGEIEGLTVCYCIDQEAFAKMQEVFGAFFSQTGSQLNNTCC